jgi:hypothetical protein
MAECSLSTGTSSPPPARAHAVTSAPPDDERLLVGERHAPAGRERGERSPEAGRADHRS